VPVTPAYFSLDAPRRLAHLDAALERMFAQAGPPEAGPAPAASAGRELDPDLNGCQQQGRDPNQEPRSNRKLSPAPARIAGLFPGHAASQVALPVLEQVPEQAPLQAPVQATEQATVQATEQATEQTTLQAWAQVAGQLPAPLAEQTAGSFPEQAREPNPPTSFEPPPPLRGPRDLQPLPLKGIPGWAAENQDPAYYRDERQFRPGRLRDRGAGVIDGSADATRGANPGGTPAHTARKPSTPNTTSKPSKPNTKSTPSTPNTTSTTSTPSTPSTPGTPGTPSSRRATRANNTKPRPGP